MTTPQQSPGAQPVPGQPGDYEIRIVGHIDTRWSERFGGLRLTHEDDGTTTIHGPVIDQAALHGLLRSVRDLGLPLISVRRVEPDQPQDSTPTNDSR